MIKITNNSRSNADMKELDNRRNYTIRRNIKKQH